MWSTKIRYRIWSFDHFGKKKWPTKRPLYFGGKNRDRSLQFGGILCQLSLILDRNCVTMVTEWVHVLKQSIQE